MAGVINDVPDGCVMIGIPATPEREQKVKQAAFAKLPEMRREFKILQRGRRQAQLEQLGEAAAAGYAEGHARRAVGRWREKVVSGQDSRGTSVAVRSAITRNATIRGAKGDNGATWRECGRLTERRASTPVMDGRRGGWASWPAGDAIRSSIAESLRRQGVEVYCLGVSGHAEPGLEEVCDALRLDRTVQDRPRDPLLQAARRHRSHHGRQDPQGGPLPAVALAQASARPRRRSASSSRTSSRGARTAATTRSWARSSRRSPPRESASARPPTTRRASWPSEGQLTERGPSAAQWRDIEFGWEMAKRMGRLDIGQSVCVKDQAVMAVEAVEGTDQCIRRAGTLCRAGGFTVVKVAKPRQDMRFDVPTVGLRTLETMLGAGGKVLAIEAGRTILLATARRDRIREPKQADPRIVGEARRGAFPAVRNRAIGVAGRPPAVPGDGFPIASPRHKEVTLNVVGPGASVPIEGKVEEDRACRAIPAAAWRVLPAVSPPHLFSRIPPQNALIGTAPGCSSGARASFSSAVIHRRFL